uniref:Metallo-beta-lactamase domain-containing protein n=2 Tax=Kalmanozyma brasiliensis (strain GHG001) TaxID=1365824 RepID=V5EQB9_KALBG
MASKQLLTIEEPSFDFDSDAKLKATWLGHAGVLVQLPPLTPKGRPIRVLFDPIFSQRCSPTQVAGPIRSYAPPCPISSLPPIDLVIISHNHYDHLDYDTVRDLWAANKDRLRFVVPLGNKDWFIGSAAGEAQAQQPAPSTATSPSTESLSSSWSFTPSAATTSALSIPAERVTELDWWAEVHLTQAGADADEGEALRVVCTPAQHGSGRYGVDTNCALWSSWYLEHPHSNADGTPTKLYFGGDTGCQFHGPSFPPAPPLAPASVPTTPASETGDSLFPNQPLRSHPTYRGGAHLSPDDELSSPYPPCPAFSEIITRLGHPSFLMLPISVGATISFLRSYIPLPDSISPFPRLTPGLTAANHMPPWDAVRVFDEMTSGQATCMAIHWGTFISGPEEVLKTLGQLKWACEQMGVRFARGEDAIGEKGKTFVALNHGGSITL